ncbi:Uncharacterised protein [Klebsiella pneumoniae]|nr:Uncharacterised protein [Klebsiella pneumoniae]
MSKFNFEEMIAALSPKREAVELNGFKFYARPMTVSEFGEAFYQGKDKEDRNDIMILECIEHEDGSKVFDSLEQVKALIRLFALNLLVPLLAQVSLLKL